MGLKNKLIFKLGALNAGVATILGAAGGHQKTWTEEQHVLFKTASLYHYLTAFGMMINGIAVPSAIPGALFLSGSVLFCGPVYDHAFSNEKRYIKVTPLGGGSMILGWMLLAFL